MVAKIKTLLGRKPAAALALLGFVALSGFPAPSMASVEWSCDCAPPSDTFGSDCICDGYFFQMKPSATKDFDGRCSGRTPGSGKTLTPKIKQTGGKGITCRYFDTPTKAGATCTNWNLVHKTVSMRISCSAPE